MAEQIEGAVESVKETVAESTATPTTNKTWDQSEHDRAIAEALRAERAKYADYDKFKQTAKDAQSKLDEIELKEKSELEKKEIEVSKLTEKVQGYENSLKNYTLKESRDKVLSDPKYSGLPSVYKNSVGLSENELDIQLEADKVLEQFNQDFNVKGQSFGKPNTINPTVKTEKPTGLIASANDLKSKLVQRFNIS